MNTLILYNKETGDIIFTQTNATETYNCLVEDISDNKEVIGIDIENKKCVLADRQATTEEKEALKRELEAKNKELEKTKQELLQTQATIVDITVNNLLK